VSLFHSSTHDPLILSVFPNSQSFCITNASHLPSRKPPPFPLDVQEDETGQLADTAEQMHLGAQHEVERNVDASDAARPEAEDAKLPLLKGWRIDTESGEDTASKLITCAMGLGGRVIIGVGANKSLWVWRYDE
jgi:polycomb protein EED